VLSLRALTVALIVSAMAVTLPAQAPAPFHVEETPIADIHAALRTGRVSCRGLVERYLRRIDAYDKNGPALNAIVLVNPQALADADALDARAKQGGS
jgi:amidase